MGYNDRGIQNAITHWITVSLHPVIVSVSREIKLILKPVICTCWEKHLGYWIYLEWCPKNVLKYILWNAYCWTLEALMMGNLKYGFNFHGLNNRFSSSENWNRLLYIPVKFIFIFHMVTECCKNLLWSINMINIPIFISSYVLLKTSILFY